MKGKVLGLGLLFIIILFLPKKFLGQSAEEHFKIGLDLAKKKRLDEAISHFEMARKQAPLNPNIHYNLANAYFLKGRYEEAELSYRKTISIDWKRVDAHFNLAILYGVLGRLDDAISSLLDVLKINPKEAEAHYLLARAYYFKREYEKAWLHHEKARKLGWNVPISLTDAIKKMRGKGLPNRR
jgi:tetratricopeptide (TPR) repeat protein